MTAKDLRRKYLEFFVSKGHSVIGSAPLVPENDPTVLFTTAGMHPLVPFLLGQKHPHGKRLVNCQKCIRTGDIDEVGDAVHLTFFEMLGNWSLGDYFKKDAIEFSFEFLTSSKCLGLSMDKLAVTVFEGDADCPFDEEAFNHWRRLGFAENRITRRPKKDNWWGPAGQTGPCGPDTEMFYWTGPADEIPSIFTPDDRRWVEIWNDVFMQYNKAENGSYEPLSQQNVDTGMGVERVTAILQGKKSCYETELFQPLFAKIRELEKVSEGDIGRSERIIADHLRAATFIIADGVVPGNVDQSYVLRRLIRRSIREGRKLGIDCKFTHLIAGKVVEDYADTYPELGRGKEKIFEALKNEEDMFEKTLEKGTREFEKLIGRVPPHIAHKVVSGKNAFNLYETYGFPLELTEEIAREKGFSVEKEGFDKAYQKHQELSRQGAEQKFKGGLSDNSEMTTNLHTATHMLHEALRKILGPHVAQKGSNITAERLRFDFSHPDKMTPEQISSVEFLVNEMIKRSLDIKCEETTVEDAKSKGAIGLFVERYGDKVRMYSIGDFSREICGGPHADNTSKLGIFKILKEESSSQGVRRIKAILTKE